MRCSVPGIIVSDPASSAVAATPSYDAASVSDAFPPSIDGPETMVTRGVPGAKVAARSSVNCAFGARASLVFRTTKA